MIILAFKVGSHVPEGEINAVSGLGENGLWLAFLAGFFVQIVCQLFYIL